MTLFSPWSSEAGTELDIIFYTIHDDVIKWKHFPRYWPFVRVIHRSPVNSPHKGQWRGALMSSLICALNKGLSKQSWGWWFETPSRPIWRHCNESVLGSWSLSGVPDFFDRNKILSGGDLSHYQVPHCIRVFFYFVWFVFIHHNFQFYFELCTVWTFMTFWIFTYHKIWILLIIFCFIWNYV